MAQIAYLTLNAESQGLIEGECTTVGQEGKIEVFETKHFVHYPLDAVSGLPTTSKKHKPITIRKKIDKSTPMLLSAWINNEVITDWKLDFYRPDTSGTGITVQFYTIELENASIVSIRFVQPNLLDPQTQNDVETEEITFSYSKLTTTHPESGNSAEHDLTITN